jgi:hypothetical protein
MLMAAVVFVAAAVGIRRKVESPAEGGERGASRFDPLRRHRRQVPR